MKKTILSSVFFIILAFSGCYYDKYEVLYPAQPACDTANSVTYNIQVKAVFQTYCTSCHSPAGGNAGGYNYLDYNSAKTAAPRLIGSVNHLAGFSPMPNSATTIDACSIAKIEKWVKSGTPQ